MRDATWGVQGVATGVSVLYPSMEKNGLIDIDVLVQVPMARCWRQH